MVLKNLLFIMVMAFCVAANAADKVDKAGASWREPVTGMEFVAIPKGCYPMGNEKALAYVEEWPGMPLTNTPPFNEELPRHEVCVDALWMGRHEVQGDEWQRVMGGPAQAGGAPVANVTWQQAVSFARRLTELSGGKYQFRLPTEAEWEYACRAGTENERMPQRAELVDRAWYVGDTSQMKRTPQPVGKLAANAFGLHDMLGNVWEWVQDSYQVKGYQKHGLYNPLVSGSGQQKVIRGASFRSESMHVRCARRGQYDEKASLPTIGLRLVRTQ